MSIARPIFRSSRRVDFDAQPGQTSFAAAGYFVWDVADVAVWRKSAAAPMFERVTSGYSVTLGAASEPTVWFATPPRASLADPAVTIRVESRRIDERPDDVTRSSVVRSAPIETRHDQLATINQELRRDIDEAFTELRRADLIAAALRTPEPTATLPVSVARAGMLLGFDAAGAPKLYPPGYASGGLGPLPQMAASPTLGAGYVMPADTAITVNVPGDAATIQAALAGTSLWLPTAGSWLRIQLAGHMPTVADLGSYARSDGLPVTIAGPTPAPLTVTGMSAPTGTAGNRVLNVTFADVSALAVGDGVRMTGYAPSYPDSGSLPAGSPPRAGAFNHAYLAGSGNCQLTTTRGSTAVSFSQAVTTVECPIGSILFIAGYIRRVVDRPTTTTATLASTIETDLPAHVYWSILAVETGTVTVSAGNVTGVGTAFLSRVSPGDILVFPDIDRISTAQSVASDTALACENNFTISTATSYALIQRPWEIEGTFEVLSINAVAKSAQLKSTSWAEYPPPFRGLIPSSCSAIKASLNTTGGGLAVVGSNLTLDAVMVRGWTSVSTGVRVNGRGGAMGAVIFKNGAATMGFRYGVYGDGPTVLEAPGGHFMGAGIASVYLTNGAAGFIDSGVAHGAGVYGLLQDGGHVYGSRLRTCCNRETGRRIEVGGSFYGDWTECSSNGGRGDQCIGAIQIHFVGCRWINNGGQFAGASGCNLQNGPRGRISGGVALRNRGFGFDLSSAPVEASFVVAMGNYQGGLSAQACAALQLDRFACVTNYGAGATVRTSFGGAPRHTVRNNAGGFVMTFTMFELSLGTATGNVSGSYKDVTLAAGSRAYVQGHHASSVFAPAKNGRGSGDTLVFDDAMTG